MKYDVAIVGGGPAGSTCGTLLRKYSPHLKVVILEREQFPRDHVGESQLPMISKILDEMGVWDKVERANFPIKVGATYRWGRTDDLWDFQFIPNGELKPEARPAKFAGQRTQTAFQVDRAVYDKILLDHAASVGCEVRQQTTVRQVLSDGDTVQGLVLEGGEVVEASHYVDASGHVGVIRRAMGVETQAPTTLQNIAIWDYWQNAEWAVKIGIGGTRVQVMSLGYGWIWFIPLGPTRTSVGLIVPAQYYKDTGKKPQDLYLEALHSDPIIEPLLRNATSEGQLSTTKDWSFLADRLAGENWFLAGESAGFADPILAAGMSLAHAGAREVAYTILAMRRGDYEAEWLRSRYDESHRRQIGQHIRFADFWYTHNGLFGDLKDLTREIAGEQGLALSAEEAWRWFGQGGFIDHDAVGTGFGGYSLTAVKQIAGDFIDGQLHFEMEGRNHFVANLEGAEKTFGATLAEGRIARHRCYKRDGKIVPNHGICGWLLAALKTPKTLTELMQPMRQGAVGFGPAELYETLEAMISDGWITSSTVEGIDRVITARVDNSAVITRRS
ncbi:MAG: NAD(P)/FAD-dependent oxidoreductase [Fimbriimonas sp.]